MSDFSFFTLERKIFRSIEDYITSTQLGYSYINKLTYDLFNCLFVLLDSAQGHYGVRVLCILCGM